jgi:small-conductance mechanosensitive channel
MLRTLAMRIINKRIADIRNRYIWRQTISYIILALGILLVIRLWFEWFQSILTVLSLIAAALTIVAKELILNFLAYGIIIWRGLFTVGDRIQIGDHAGDVTEIGPSYFSLAEIGHWISTDEPTGRSVKVPNSTILTQPVANYARGMSLIWNEITISLTASSDWRQAKSLLITIGQKRGYTVTEEEQHALRTSTEEIMFTRTDPDVHCRIEEEKLTLTLRYLCKFHQRHTTEQQIWDDILDQFSSKDAITLLTKETP